MNNSPLATYVRKSPNKTSPKSYPIDHVVIHCYVGQVTAKDAADYFANASAASAPNYSVGKDGSISMSVDEKDRAWTTGGKDKYNKPIYVNGISGAMMDHRAITIEVACDKAPPYAVTDLAYNALIDLLVDICKRNPLIGQLRWKGDKSLVGKPEQQNMAVHRWFANKECPGDWLYKRQGEIADTVNARLLAEQETDKNDESEALEMTVTKDELRALIRETVVEVYNELNPVYVDLKDVPGYWQDAAKKFLEMEVVDGGTTKEQCATDLNLRRETLKAIVVAARYHDKESK